MILLFKKEKWAILKVYVCECPHINPFVCMFKTGPFLSLCLFLSKILSLLLLTRVYLLEGNTESKYYKSGHCTSNNSYNDKINTNSKL